MPPPVQLLLGGARGYQRAPGPGRRAATPTCEARRRLYLRRRGEEDSDAREWEETPETTAASEEDGDDSEEVEGFTLDFSSFLDGDGEREEEGTNEEV